MFFWEICNNPQIYFVETCTFPQMFGCYFMAIKKQCDCKICNRIVPMLFLYNQLFLYNYWIWNIFGNSGNLLCHFCVFLERSEGLYYHLCTIG